MNSSTSGIPLDITSSSFSGQVRENYTTDEVAANFTFDKVLPYSSGSLFISIPANETATLTQRKYVYDVMMETPAATRRILEGSITVRPAVTR
jgi:hypothetical protein